MGAVRWPADPTGEDTRDWSVFGETFYKRYSGLQKSSTGILPARCPCYFFHARSSMSQRVMRARTSSVLMSCQRR
jgi:hypothetical protein